MKHDPSQDPEPEGSDHEEQISRPHPSETAHLELDALRAMLGIMRKTHTEDPKDDANPTA